ncbi:nitroreductase family protein [Chloroflexota bacterium]
METLEAIGKRVSLKTRISPRDIEQENIIKILDAARLAPSAYNNQPWRFIIIKGKEAVETVVSGAFNEVNLIAKEAPVIIIACAHPKDDEVVSGREYYLFDVALAIENMLLAATDLGLVTHLMTSVNEDKLKNMLNIPNEVRFVVATPLAYPSNESYDMAAQEKLDQRTRKALKEIAYSNVWGKSF